MNSQTYNICCQHSVTEGDYERMTTRTLMKLGVPANTKGFHYIKTAVLLGIENPIGLTSMSKFVYPAIAERYKSDSIASIERAMRYAISQSCVRGDCDFICELFYFTDNIKYYNPTNREFLAVVVEYIKQFCIGNTGSLVAS
ncbi:MAG: sporulation initiation factor Spo0A C-terminal domain-containing protein [Ruminococcus sp.]|nr:sporulation initiation factor Spo0A C-terminal domain-containing protein [Ruminococcus sp.]